MAIADKLNTIRQAIQNMKNALISKGCTVSGDITTFADAVESITTSEDVIIEAKEITPSTTQQIITAPENVGGYNPITVNPVTSAIDQNIISSNIKNGISILGVNGSLVALDGETKNVSLTSSSGQTFTPSNNKNGITSITVTPTNQNRTVNPSTSSQTLSINSGYSGNGTITVNPVTSAIDQNISAENIKKNITILGTTGTYEGEGSSSDTVNVKMTSNGVLGGNTFAVDSTTDSTTDLWKMFDGNSSTYYSNNNAFTFTFYSPNGIVLTGINVTSGGTYAIALEDTLSIKGSNDNSTWTTLTYTGSIDYNNNIGIQISNADKFKYFKFENFYTERKNIYEISLIGSYGESIGINREITNSGVYKISSDNYTFILPSTVTDIDDNAMKNIFYGCGDITAVNLSSLINVSGSYAMAGAFQGSAVKNVALPNLTSISGSYALYNAFYGCSRLLTLNLSNLTTVSGTWALAYAFQSCEDLDDIDLSNLTTIGTNALYQSFCDCTQLVTMSFPSLNNISSSNVLYEAFSGCSKLTTLSFPSLKSTSFGSFTNQFSSMLYGVTGCTVHFPSNLQSVIGSWNDVLAGFGGTNTTVLFDLAATESSNSGDVGCVLYNTSILMADDTTKEAQDIEIDDLIQTYNEDTKTFESNKVLAVMKNQKDDIIKVTFEDESEIELTSGHPFLTEKGWASYDNEKTIKENLYNGADLYQLEIGDKCLTQDGYLEIVNIETEDLGKVDVYDFTIENAHTFLAGKKNGLTQCRIMMILHNAISTNG